MHSVGFTVEHHEVWHLGYILIPSDRDREAQADQEIIVFKNPSACTHYVRLCTLLVSGTQ